MYCPQQGSHVLFVDISSESYLFWPWGHWALGWNQSKNTTSLLDHSDIFHIPNVNLLWKKQFRGDRWHHISTFKLVKCSVHQKEGPSGPWNSWHEIKSKGFIFFLVFSHTLKDWLRILQIRYNWVPGPITASGTWAQDQFDNALKTLNLLVIVNFNPNSLQFYPQLKIFYLP